VRSVLEDVKRSRHPSSRRRDRAGSAVGVRLRACAHPGHSTDALCRPGRCRSRIRGHLGYRGEQRIGLSR